MSWFALGGRPLPTLQAGASPFEIAIDRIDGRVEHVGHLAGVESEYVAQDEHGELARWQDLKSSDEGQGWILRHRRDRVDADAVPCRFKLEHTHQTP
jgi:hypothetical protein